MNAHGNLQNDLTKVFNWCVLNGMTLNARKTVVLNFGKTNPIHVYHINDVPISNVTQTRDLGIIIDNKLSFEPYILDLCHRATQRSAVLRNSFKFYNRDFALLLYKTFILPMLDYCSSVIIPKTIKLESILESVQKKYTRYNILWQNSDIPNYHERLKICNLNSIVHRRQIIDVSLLYKLINNDFYLSSDVIHFNRSNRGHSLKLFKNRFHSKLREHFWYNRSIDIFNSLPQDIVVPYNLMRLKAHLQSQFFLQL